MITLWTINKLVSELKRIKNLGYVKTTHAHQGGVGNTLETLLRVPENNLRLPDIGDIEIKAKRFNSKSMLTLSSRAPLPKGVNRVLFEAYKYKREGGYKLYSPVKGSRINSHGLRVIVQNTKLILINPKKIEAFWVLEKLDDIFKEKSSKIVLVLAKTKGELGDVNEKFHYEEAYLLSGVDLKRTQDAIKNDKLKVDIRIGFDLTGKQAGKYHDHGTGFRIHKKDYLQLFNKVRRIM